MKKRIIYLDVLRVLAIWGVVSVHVAVPLTATYLPENKAWWWVANFFSSSGRYCVPIFLMISGILMLNNDNLDMKKFYIKRIPNIVSALLVISLLQYFYSYITGNLDYISIKNYIYKLITNQIHPHLWYLYTILGVYLLTPILKYFTDYASKKDIQLFLLISFSIPFWSKLFEYIVGESITPAFIDTIFIWSISYYVLGFYLNKYGLKNKKFYYFLGILFIILTILGSYFLTLRNNNQLDGILFSFVMPTVIFPTISIFTLIQNIDWDNFFKKHPNLYNSLLRLSQTSFGVYLIHSFPIRIFSYFIDIYKLNILIAIPLISLVVWLSSHIVVLFIKKLNKLIFH